MAIRVLHIFAPNFKKRFGGPIFDWKVAFSHWNDPDVEHFVLDVEKKCLENARETFNFEVSESQEMLSKQARAKWIVPLFQTLIKNKEQYDILHFHVLWWGSLLAGQWAKWKSIPTIYQSVLLDEDTPGGIFKEKLGFLKVWLLKKIQAILAISDFLAEDYLRHEFLNDQVFTLMNSVDTGIYYPPSSPEEKKRLRQELNLPENTTVMLFVGSLIERKGADILVEAFIQATKNREDLYLFIAGPKNIKENPSLDEAFVSELYSKIDTSDLSGRVIFTGLIKDREKLANIYRASDLFVFPSRNEGLPNVVLEAMASGLPVVVSQLPGLRSVIKHGENGLVVPIGDADSLAKAMCAFTEDPVFAIKLGAMARNYILEQHSFNKWQINIVQFYKDLL